MYGTGHFFDHDQSRFSDAVTSKAESLVLDGWVRPDPEKQHVWWVRTSTDDTKPEYRVEVREELASCSCRYGRNTGGSPTCSHVLAAVLYAASHSR